MSRASTLGVEAPPPTKTRRRDAKTSRRRLRIAIVAAAGSAAAWLAPSPARTILPDTGFLNWGTIVGDAELAGMRGRFVNGNVVTYFAVQLYSVWQTIENEVLATALDFGVDLTGGGVDPTVSFFHSEAGDVDANTDILALLNEPENLVTHLNPEGVTARGLETATGVAQSARVAGDVNNVLQELDVFVIRSRSESSLANPAGPRGEPLPLTETTTVTFDTGATATAFIEANRIGIVMKMQGGTIKQEISTGQLGQHTVLHSDRNLVTQSMVINVARSNSPPVATLGGLIDTLRLLD